MPKKRERIIDITPVEYRLEFRGTIFEPFLAGKKRNIEALSTDLNSIVSTIRNSFTALCACLVLSYVDRQVKILEGKIQTTHNSKLSRLGANPDVSSLNPDRVVLNYSSYGIPKKLKILLSFGLDFGLPINKLNPLHFFFSGERILAALKNEPIVGNKSSFFQEFSSSVYNHYRNFRPYKIFSPIFDKENLKILNNFRNNKNIVITRPDKGRGVVILDKTTYKSKLNDIISDVTKFQPISEPIEDYTVKVEDRINYLLRKLKKDNIINTQTFQSLYVSGSNPGTLYGLPKVHKSDFSTEFQFRPIFASYNTPSYNIAKHLVPILEPLTTNQYTVTNSTSFVKTIQDQSGASNLYMASFDVSNLFSNILVMETIDICVNNSNLLSNSLTSCPKILKKFLKLALLNSFFIFDGKYFKQTEGLGMGLPLGPTFTNIFMCHHETRWLEDCPSEFKPVLYRRYIWS